MQEVKIKFEIKLLLSEPLNIRKSHHLVYSCFFLAIFKKLIYILHPARYTNPVTVAATNTDELVHEVKNISENAKELLTKINPRILINIGLVLVELSHLRKRCILAKSIY